MNPSKLTKKAKEEIEKELEQDKEKIKNRIDKILGNHDDSYIYRKRLDKIYKMMTEHLFMEGKVDNLLKTSDFFQRIELCMNYKEGVDQDGNKFIDANIYEIIGQVFRSMYINFIITFLEGDDTFSIPYLGKLKVREVDRYNTFLNKNVHYFYGRILLDEYLRKDLKRIEKGEKLEVIEKIFKEIEKDIGEKVV